MIKRKLFINQINSIIWDNLYIHDLSPFLLLNAGILNIPGIRLIKIGKMEEIAKLNNESFIKCFWVFSYIQQKQDI